MLVAHSYVSTCTGLCALYTCYMKTHWSMCFARESYIYIKYFYKIFYILRCYMHTIMDHSQILIILTIMSVCDAYIFFTRLVHSCHYARSAVKVNVMFIVLISSPVTYYLLLTRAIVLRPIVKTA